MEFINILMADAIKVNGRMENNTVKELSWVLKEYLVKESGNKESDYTGSMRWTQNTQQAKIPKELGDEAATCENDIKFCIIIHVKLVLYLDF
jgi:hypothetical protein